VSVDGGIRVAMDGAMAAVALVPARGSARARDGDRVCVGWTEF
jgi:hypothetical protein